MKRKTLSKGLSLALQNVRNLAMDLFFIFVKL